MKNFYIILLFIFFINCNNVNSNYELNKSGTFEVESDDLEMLTAIEKARNSFEDFVVAFKSDSVYYDYFSIKVPLKTNDNSLEHIWLSQLELVDDEFYGIIDNVPVNINGKLLGSRLKIDKNSISDWMFIDNGKLRGGFTILLLRSYMTKVEREEFDKDCGFIIE